MKNFCRARSLIVLLIAGSPDSFSNEIAAHLTFFSWFNEGTPVADSNHGWEFTVTRPITLTHIGLLDVTAGNNPTPNGLIDSHEVGLFLTDGTLLTSGTLGSRTGNTVVDNFRYVAVPRVSLQPQYKYVVAYYTGRDRGDIVVTDLLPLQMHPFVKYTAGRWGSGDSLAIPENTTTDYRFGPNFLFQVPEPATSVLAALSVVGLCLRRDNR